MKPIDFKTSNYFTGMPHFGGFVALAAGILLLTAGKYILGGVACISAFAVLTTHYRIQVDFDRKIYSEYIFFFGMKTSRESGAFDLIEYIYIKKCRVSQQLNSRVQSTTIHKWQYDGYLKFSEEKKIHLITSDDKTILKTRLRSIAETLRTKVVDYSNETELNAS
jgi:hypothetical protein